MDAYKNGLDYLCKDVRPGYVCTNQEISQMKTLNTFTDANGTRYLSLAGIMTVKRIRGCGFEAVGVREDACHGIHGRGGCLSSPEVGLEVLHLFVRECDWEHRSRRQHPRPHI
jgi:hypothetical protein